MLLMIFLVAFFLTLYFAEGIKMEMIRGIVLVTTGKMLLQKGDHFSCFCVDFSVLNQHRKRWLFSCLCSRDYHLGSLVVDCRNSSLDFELKLLSLDFPGL